MGRTRKTGATLPNLSAHKGWMMDPFSLQPANQYPEVLEQLDAGIRTINAVNLSKYVSGMSPDISYHCTMLIAQMSAAAYAIFLYDWVLCFSEEIRLVLPAKWSLVKLLYFQVSTYTRSWSIVTWIFLSGPIRYFLWFDNYDLA
jgi:hypothetical protein